MSNSTLSDIFPSGLTLTGGIPIKSQDLGASVAFTLAYFVLLPLAVWRLASSSSRCFALIRPAIFVLARIGTYAVRARISQGHYEKGLFIAEQILLLCGFILLCEPLITLLGFHIIRNHIPTGQPQPILMRVQAVLKLGLLAALVLGVYAGVQIGDVKSDGSDSGTINTIKTCRDANVIISLVIVVLAAVVAVVACFRETPQIPLLPTLHLVSIASFLAIASIYKMVYYYSSPSPVSVGTKVGFYLLSALPELCACILEFAINLNTNYEIREARQKQKDDKAMRDGTYVGSSYKSDLNFGPQSAYHAYPPMNQGSNV